ncbi:MAG: dienelactone hydrolase family protein [Nibricoccus sp.]
MGKDILLRVEDGHLLGAYESGDPVTSSAAIVLLQEIFGVNAHIRSVADEYAKAGYYVVTPALFDRVQARVQLDYSPAELELARGYASRLEPELVLRDIAAAIAHARARIASGKVGVVGFCLGGTYAFLSATRLNPDAAVGYYGGKIVQHAHEVPLIPTILHFGSQDRGISLSDVQAIEHTRPEVPVYIYEAGHAFNRTGGANYSEAAASLARERTLAFLRTTLTEQVPVPIHA